MHLIKLIIFLLVLIIPCGCGYSFSGGEGLLSGTVHSVSVQIFENKSQWPDLDVIFTNDIISELLLTRSVKLNDAPTSTKFYGTIERVRVDTLNRSADGKPQEKYVEITICAYFKDSKGKKIWQSRSIKDRESYFPSNTHQETLTIQKNAIKRISKRLAVTVIDELGQGF
ncbi:conserved hypothetical protein, secreted [Candidatus Magnetomorum sp. HK-1]|nr:conserved hypothetical protein, secreted [Candidatus Magnetomorum sp. HK-1]